MTEQTGYNRKKSEYLADQGFKKIQEGEYESALKIAKELEDLRYTAAYDIAAQAYAGLGEIEKSVETLERGLKKAPDCWLNWQLLGNYSSDMEDYEKAEEAYIRAMDCPNVRKESILLNQAILAGRLGNHNRSLVLLSKIKDDSLTLESTSAKIHALHRLGKHSDALSLADTCLSEHREPDEPVDALGYIVSKKCRILLEQGSPPEEVRLSAMEAIEEFGPHTELFTLIRDIDSRFSSYTKYFKLLVHAAIPEWSSQHDDVTGYYVTYDVVAENPEEALEWVKEFEDSESDSLTLVIEEVDILEERPNEPMGVYWRSGRVYHEDDE